MENNVFLNGVSRNDLAFALGFSCHGYKNRTDQAEDMRAARERVRKALGESMAMDGLMAFIEDMEKPRPIRFADLPVVDSLDQLSLGHQIELLRDALDHIAKTCHQSRQSTRRIRWIEARANGALEGKPYDAKLIELPVKVDREIDRMKRRDSQQVARIWEFEALLIQSNELLYAIQGDPGAVPSSSIDAMRGKVFTALNGVPATCTWSSAEFSWSSTCGMAGWEFTDGGTPAENGMKFCHCCGKPITVAVPEDEA